MEKPIKSKTLPKTPNQQKMLRNKFILRERWANGLIRGCVSIVKAIYKISKTSVTKLKRKIVEMLCRRLRECSKKERSSKASDNKMKKNKFYDKVKF